MYYHPDILYLCVCIFILAFITVLAFIPTKNPSRHNNKEILATTHILYRMQFFQQSRLALTPLKKHGSHTKDMHSQFIKLVYFKVQKILSACMPVVWFGQHSAITLHVLYGRRT